MYIAMLYHESLYTDNSRALWQMWQFHLKPFTRERAAAVKAPIQQIIRISDLNLLAEGSSKVAVDGFEPAILRWQAGITSTRRQARTGIAFLSPSLPPHAIVPRRRPTPWKEASLVLFHQAALLSRRYIIIINIIIILLIVITSSC